MSSNLPEKEKKFQTREDKKQQQKLQQKSETQQFLENEVEEIEKSKLKKGMRTAEDVFNRIKWDNDMKLKSWMLGYEDRFLGLQEISFEEFPTSDMPFHRIQYFRDTSEDGSGIIWDKRIKLDAVFNSSFPSNETETINSDSLNDNNNNNNNNNNNQQTIPKSS